VGSPTYLGTALECETLPQDNIRKFKVISASAAHHIATQGRNGTDKVGTWNSGQVFEMDSTVGYGNLCGLVP
jgi:hypothetical protein